LFLCFELQRPTTINFAQKLVAEVLNCGRFQGLLSRSVS
jgi:hypothetical protein